MRFLIILLLTLSCSAVSAVADNLYIEKTYSTTFLDPSSNLYERADGINIAAGYKNVRISEQAYIREDTKNGNLNVYLTNIDYIYPVYDGNIINFSGYVGFSNVDIKIDSNYNNGIGYSIGSVLEYKANGKYNYILEAKYTEIDKLPIIDYLYFVNAGVRKYF